MLLQIGSCQYTDTYKRLTEQQIETVHDTTKPRTRCGSHINRNNNVTMDIRKLRNRQECSHVYLDKDRTKRERKIVIREQNTNSDYIFSVHLPIMLSLCQTLNTKKIGSLETQVAVCQQTRLQIPTELDPQEYGISSGQTIQFSYYEPVRTDSVEDRSQNEFNLLQPSGLFTYHQV